MFLIGSRKCIVEKTKIKVKKIFNVIVPISASTSPNQHLAVATVYYNPPNGVNNNGSSGGQKSKGHERKDSLPQIVSVPQANIPKVK